MSTATANGRAAPPVDIDVYREELKAAAREYIKAGLPITVCEGKNPGHWLAMGGEWHTQRLSSEQAEALIDRANHPTVGIIHGTGGSVVFDVDSKGELRAAMDLFDHAPPPMPIDDTGRESGQHRHAAFDHRLTATGAATIKYVSAADPADSITVRIGADGKGAHSVVAPSLHAVEMPKGSNNWQWSGKRYTWRPDCDLETLGLPRLPDVVVDRLLAAAKPKSQPRNGKPTGTARPDVLAAMRKATRKMADGNDGSKRLLTLTCRGVELNASDDEIVAAVRAVEIKAPFPRSFSDDEIVARVRDAERTVERGAAVVISNFEEIEVEAESLLSDSSDSEPNAEKETKIITVPKSMGTIIEEIHKLTSGWPRRVDSVMFIDDAAHGLDWFDRRTTAGLFGWLRRLAVVKWLKGGSYVAQSELFAEIERTARRYEAIELLPHEPTIEGIYYRGGAPAPGDGKHLRKLLDRFRPETTVDRDLIQAAFMTAFWGGLPGCRPAFVVTSDDGRGVGKSKVAEAVGLLCGGHIDVSAGEDIETLKTRMLTPAARTKRIALLDNVKSLRLSWAELEAMITAPVISGRQLYVGEGQRPNLLTWFLTLNGVSMATDMAQRSVIIKVVKGKNDGPWWEQTRTFIDQHRQKIIGDIIGALRGEAYPLAEFTRWATWEQHVLTRLPEPGEAQRLILERQGTANCEQDEAEIIEEHFAEQLHRLGYRPDTAQVRIPVAIAARWFGWAVNDRVHTAAASKRLHQMASEGQMRRIAPDAGRRHGRGFIWTGPSADVVGEPILNDLNDRIAAASQESGR